MPPLSERQKLKKRLKRYEGDVEHMYLDSVGFVTVGIGHMLAGVAEAQKLPFLDQKGNYASKTDIKNDYDAVKKQSPNKLAGYYKRFTKLHLSQIEINRQVNQHINTFYKELKRIYPDYDTYPSEARLALMDMIFNMGMTKMKNKFPKLNTAVKARDWATAAKESRRKAPSGCHAIIMSGTCLTRPQRYHESSIKPSPTLPN
jgi:GH24 family phage-related lysozyme (muramidase)